MEVTIQHDLKVGSEARPWQLTHVILGRMSSEGLQYEASLSK
jgi:hypothetical protein